MDTKTLLKHYRRCGRIAGSNLTMEDIDKELEQVYPSVDLPIHLEAVEFVNAIRQAYNRMTNKKLKRILFLAYLNAQPEHRYKKELYHSLGMSESNYYRVQAEAIRQLGTKLDSNC
ncbi:DNA-directed RNA polymerase specialized sigma subunit [Streptococcus gallinaceus]|uniref:hypothetical protein n=1 Tax=Streptococcus gallinaceus TaxID=165758 RepID=UPI00209F3933|nr:hypothetical protein [Streptococcus gallinaceus]MCP1640172.1 DNA-directed RNA polymerase specialized sigma subunit [Streptococcus gallinaceus]MCP1770954.1 DNA-directed RNA polymerase specialized sigma subunit [Streptococcus gallinaceus]